MAYIYTEHVAQRK